MFSLDDIFDFLRRNLFLVLGVLVFIVRSYGQYVESSKKAQLENQRKFETAQQQERAQGYEGYLERTSATKLDDGRDDFSQTGQHNGPRPATQDTRGFDDLARDLQQARTQNRPASDSQTELRRLLEEKMGRTPKTTSTSSQNTANQNTSSQGAPPSIGRPSSKPPPSKRPASNAFEPDRTAASTFMPSSVTAPNSLEQNRVIEASFERTLNKSKLEPKTMDAAPKTRGISGTTFSSQDAVRAVIWSEVLGTPKSRRR